VGRGGGEERFPTSCVDQDDILELEGIYSYAIVKIR
jgi:hypothetical protein